MNVHDYFGFYQLYEIYYKISYFIQIFGQICSNFIFINNCVDFLFEDTCQSESYISTYILYNYKYYFYFVFI